VFYSPTDAQVIFLKTKLKFTLKNGAALITLIIAIN
jgi:hypothetical protein